MATPSVAEVTISNTGTAAADDIIIEVNGNGGSLSSYLLTHSDAMQPIEMDIDVTQAANACVGGDGVYRDTIRNINLDPGETITINFSVSYSCDCNECSIRNIYNPTFSVISYIDNCGSEFNGNAVSPGSYDAYMDGFVEGPLDLVNGQSGTIEYTVTGVELDWLDPIAYPNAYFEKVFEIPCGLDYVPGSIQMIDRNGVVYPICSIIAPDTGGDDEIIIRWCSADRPPGFIVSAAMEISIDVIADCGEKPPPPDCGSPIYSLMIKQSSYFSTDATCDIMDMPCVRQKIQDTIAIETRIVCPDPGCPCPGMVFTDLTIERTNFGFGDTNNDQIPDGSIDPNTRKDRYLQGDTLKATFQGIINDPSGLTWEYAYAIIDFDNPNFTPLSATVYINDDDGGDFTCNAVPISVDANNDLIVDFSIAGLNANGCGPFAPFNFDDMDSISVCINFITKDPFAGMQRMIIYDTEFYVAETARGEVGHMPAQCNGRSVRLTQIGLTEGENLVVLGLLVHVNYLPGLSPIVDITEQAFLMNLHLK